MLDLRGLTVVVDTDGRITFSDLPEDIRAVARSLSEVKMNDILTMSAQQIQQAVSKKEISPVEVTRAFLERIQDVDAKIGAFLYVDPELAIKQAQQVEKDVLAGNVGMLSGVPVAVKDIFDTRDMPTTAGSKILDGFRPPFDATVVQRLRGAGAILLGKTNMDEFAMGSTGENSAYKTTHNPWDLAKAPGGSSGGSAAALAALQAPLALGTDTGGSIRQPAALCGVVGLKPTYGRVSRYGIIAFASSLDQAGPMARCVGDAALMMQVIAGVDPRDSTSLPVPVPDYVKGVTGGLSGVTVGLVRNFVDNDGVEPQIREKILETARIMREKGAIVKDVALPNAKYCIATYYIIATAEASSNLARYDGVRYGMRKEEPGKDLDAMYRATRGTGFGDEVKRRIILGTFVLSSGYADAYYQRALRVRTMIRGDFEDVFKDVDLLLMPTSPVAAVGLGEKVADPLSMYLLDEFTVCVNLAGLPGISVPAGLDTAGHPMGVQVVGPQLAETGVLNAARAIEDAFEFYKQTPTINPAINMRG